MTFTIVGRCRTTGHLGICMATSSPAVGNRCSFVSRDGAVAFQAVAEPRLGAATLRLLEARNSPRAAIEQIRTADDWPQTRQIGIVDSDGRSAAFTGEANIPWAGHRVGPDYVAMGNVLAGAQVAAAIEAAFLVSEGLPIEERLVRAIEAGRDAGGQEEGQVSASLITFGREPVARCDLRVDLNAEPIAELRRIYDWYAPLIPYFVARTADPNQLRYKDWLAKQGHVREYR
jgi:uncharacterized Ntn-hydrolase superfamily protein